jgi:nucleoside-diphosphate kinase
LNKLINSGEAEALILEREDAIKKWRELLGPTKIFKTIYSHPESIRGLYGITDTRNACHGSDSVQSVMEEIKKVFPDFDFDKREKSSSDSR